MKFSILLVCIFLSLPAFCNPIKVFILAGQSNMEGQGVVSMNHEEYYNGGKGNLVWSMEQGKTKEMMKHLKDATGKWLVRNDVDITFKNKKGIRKGPLTIGFTGYGGSSHIGPELQFGHIVGDHFKENVLLIKTAWGGKSIHKDFRPPSSGGTTGEYYTKMLEEISTALAELKGQKYELSGFVWFQGWNDMGDKQANMDYEKNLINLINDVRKALKTPQLPVVIGELGNGGEKAGDKMLAIRKAQKTAAGKLDDCMFVSTTDCARDAELSPNKGHGHHWFGNAESYFLVGHKLGKAMLKLVK